MLELADKQDLESCARKSVEVRSLSWALLSTRPAERDGRKTVEVQPLSSAHMKSIYQDQEFAKYWNDRAGDNGEDYKHYVLDPLMLEKIGSLHDKDILEVGCGNGYMSKQFLAQKPKSILMMDLSPHNLAFAKKRIGENSTLTLIEHDILNP